MIQFVASGGVIPQCPKCGGKDFATSAQPKRGEDVARLDPITCNGCGHVTTIEDARAAARKAAGIG